MSLSFVLIPYSQAVLVDNTMYISGQLGIKTNGDLVDGMEAQTRLALDNIGHILRAAGATYNNGNPILTFSVMALL